MKRIYTIHPRVIALAMLRKGWLPYEIDVKLSDIADRAKTLSVALRMREAAAWTRANL